MGCSECTSLKNKFLSIIYKSNVISKWTKLQPPIHCGSHSSDAPWCLSSWTGEKTPWKSLLWLSTRIRNSRAVFCFMTVCWTNHSVKLYPSQIRPRNNQTVLKWSALLAERQLLLAHCLLLLFSHSTYEWDWLLLTLLTAPPPAFCHYCTVQLAGRHYPPGLDHKSKCSLLPSTLFSPVSGQGHWESRRRTGFKEKWEKPKCLKIQLVIFGMRQFRNLTGPI